jgi:uncharacterized protein YjlB
MPPLDPAALTRSIAAETSHPLDRSAADRAALVAEHATWREWIGRWRDDVSRWQAEHDDAIERLARLQDAVRVHGASLTAHAATFTAVEAAIASHEHLLASPPTVGAVEAAARVADAHAAQRDSLRVQRDAHERIARHHAAVLAHLKTLEAMTTAPL